MFTNIGGKIMGLARFIAWLGIILSIIYGVLTIVATSQISSFSGGSFNMGGYGVLGGILTMIIGSVISWLCSLVLYGFGQLVQDMNTTANRSNRPQ